MGLNGPEGEYRLGPYCEGFLPAPRAGASHSPRPEVFGEDPS